MRIADQEASWRACFGCRVAPRPVAAPVRAGGGLRSRCPGAHDRLLARESAPLGGGWTRRAGPRKGGVGAGDPGSSPRTRSRGGRTAKIQGLADDRGRPVAVALTPGTIADI